MKHFIFIPQLIVVAGLFAPLFVSAQSQKEAERQALERLQTIDVETGRIPKERLYDAIEQKTLSDHRVGVIVSFSRSKIHYIRIFFRYRNRANV